MVKNRGAIDSRVLVRVANDKVGGGYDLYRGNGHNRVKNGIIDGFFLTATQEVRERFELAMFLREIGVLGNDMLVRDNDGGGYGPVQVASFVTEAPGGFVLEPQHDEPLLSEAEFTARLGQIFSS